MSAPLPTASELPTSQGSARSAWPAAGKRLSRRAFLRRGAGGLVALGATGWGWSGGVENKWIEITRREHSLPRLHRAWDGVQLLQLSDIHMDEWMSRERLEGIVALANAQQADITVITGDFVTHQPGHWKHDLSVALGALHAPLGIYAVLGNHDLWDGGRAVRHALSRAGIIELRNTVHTLTRRGAPLHLAGVDDLMWGKPDLTKVQQELPREGAAVLLAHEPDFADIAASTHRFDLQLSGHSHGGQVRIPGLRPLYLPPMSQKYPIGRYVIDGLTLYTNRGLGTVGPHFRLFCRPEITMHILRSA